jgi:solute carrier family 25 carnitine/acylcarnitine transporter 20/29
VIIRDECAHTQVEAMETVIIGSISGCLAIAVCHPIDVVRTKMQVQASTFGACVRDTADKEGLRGFYKGFSGPFIAQGVYKSVLFSVNSLTQKHLFHSSRQGGALFVSGFISGSVNAVVVAPVEIIRTNLIFAKRDGTSYSLAGSIRNIASRQGIFGLWKGLLPAVMRDGPGMGFYFLAFDRAKSTLSEENKPVSLMTRILAGAAAGAGFWLVALPVDTIKTVVEAEAVNAEKTLRLHTTGTLNLISSVTRQLWNEGGIRRLYRAWPVAFGRGLPSAAITLTTFDICTEYLSKHKA